MNKQLLFAALLFAGTAFSQQGNGGLPVSHANKYLSSSFDTRTFTEPDIGALQAEDLQTDGKGIAPWRFGHTNFTDLSFANSGTWVTLQDGSLIWRLRINCENALTVNLLLDNVILPEGNELYVYNPDKSFILGSFTENHLYEGNLGTELVPGSSVIVEYYVPAANKELERNLRIHTVTHGYRTAEQFQKAFGSSGSCNMNVNCPDGAPWVNQRNSTVMLVSSGSGFCTGSLVNNTMNDGKPYVLTANHCYSNPANWVFRFNWQSANCANGSNPTFVSLSGATLRAKRIPSDFCLVEITGGLESNMVPESYGAYLSGWDHSGTIPTSSVCVHHPAGDIKKISFDDAAPSISQEMGSSEANSTWTVEWDRNTTTEGGSSGSPLYDQNHRVIGQLWGGGASCSSLSSPDYYGRFASSWEPASSNSTNQLKFWLDPNNSGVNVIDGFDPFSAPLVNDAGMGSLEGVSGRLCTTTVTPVATITNNGSQTLTSATITYGYESGAPQVYSWTGSLAQFASQEVTLNAITVPAGDHTLTVTVSAPNGTTDEQSANNVVTSEFTTVANGQTVNLTLNTDCYADETSWEVRDGGTVLYSGGEYDFEEGGLIINEEFCLAEACYSFVIMDEYGDGMSNTNGSCTAQAGSYTITQGATTLAALTEAEADFGDEDSRAFCVTSVSTAGMDEARIQWGMFPNPAEDQVTIEFGSSELNKEVSITSATGQLIKTINISGVSEKVDLSGFAGGMYLITAKTQKGISTKPLMIK